MPTRRMCLAILLFWVIAASDLFRRDLLPELVVGSPPDFRTVFSSAYQSPTRWSIVVAEDRGTGPERTVGEVVTQTTRRRDGSARLASHASFDSAQLLRGTPFEAIQDARVEILGACEVDSSGNLDTFRVSVREGFHAKTDLLVIDGRLRNDQIEVVSRGPVPMLSWNKSFPYRPHSLVQSTLSPIERMPGLQIGQRWESRVVSPLTGRIESATVEVVARRHITWNRRPVATLELVTRMAPLSARTWVRTDGVVLRQEVPFPFVRLVLERVPSEADPEPAGEVR